MSLRPGCTLKNPVARWRVARLVVICAALLSGPTAAADPAADMDKAVTAYERQEYDTALAIMRPLADQGHTEAQYFMGTFYLYGAGVEMNPGLANVWFRRAFDQWQTEARQGKATAMVEVAMMLNTGIGVDRNTPKAIEWLNRAAELNSVEAWSELGNLYLVGDGVPRDRAAAQGWYQKAANAGDTHARDMLVWMQRHSDQEIDGMLQRAPGAMF